jgi:hypothetical protein
MGTRHLYWILTGHSFVFQTYTTVLYMLTAEADLVITEDETAKGAAVSLSEDVFETIEFNQTGDILKGQFIKVVNLSFSLVISYFLNRCLMVISII